MSDVPVHHAKERKHDNLEKRRIRFLVTWDPIRVHDALEDDVNLFVSKCHGL